MAATKTRKRKPTLSVPQAAKQLGLPVRTLYHYCKIGEFPHVRLSRRILIMQEAVDAALARGDGPTGQPIEQETWFKPGSPDIEQDW
jgi:excisionase family DNA binding protein